MPSKNTRCDGMLDDPESKQVEYEEQVFANDASQAMQRCEQLAAKYTREGGKFVTAVSVRQAKGKLYICKLRGEVDG